MLKENPLGIRQQKWQKLRFGFLLQSSESCIIWPSFFFCPSNSKQRRKGHHCRKCVGFTAQSQRVLATQLIKMLFWEHDWKSQSWTDSSSYYLLWKNIHPWDVTHHQQCILENWSVLIHFPSNFFGVVDLCWLNFKEKLVHFNLVSHIERSSIRKILFRMAI